MGAWIFLYGFVFAIIIWRPNDRLTHFIRNDPWGIDLVQFGMEQSYLHSVCQWTRIDSLSQAAGLLGRLWSLIFVRFFRYVANSAWIPWRKIENMCYIPCFLMLLHTTNQIPNMGTKYVWLIMNNLLGKLSKVSFLISIWLLIWEKLSRTYFPFIPLLDWISAILRDFLKPSPLVCLLENFYPSRSSPFKEWPLLR